MWIQQHRHIHACMHARTHIHQRDSYTHLHSLEKDLSHITHAYLIFSFTFLSIDGNTILNGYKNNEPFKIIWFCVNNKIVYHFATAAAAAAAALFCVCSKMEWEWKEEEKEKKIKEKTVIFHDSYPTFEWKEKLNNCYQVINMYCVHRIISWWPIKATTICSIIIIIMIERDDNMHRQQMNHQYTTLNL